MTFTTLNGPSDDACTVQVAFCDGCVLNLFAEGSQIQVLRLC